ncbi:MAG: DNA repair protein RadA [Gemmatimonadaceae bacterium]|nr:DNA repair protein RadA [Gemmatimonadaceae bacterium]
MAMRRKKTGGWGFAAEQAALDREDALRAARPVRPSTSRVPHRCTTCREWTTPTPAGRCPVCGDWWEAAEAVGLPVVR